MDRINPYKLLSPLNIPVGYLVNPRPGKVPFLVYYGAGTDNFKADNKVYAVDEAWNIELYTKKKDVNLERKIEQILDENEIVWEKGPETYIKDDETFMVPYYI